MTKEEIDKEVSRSIQCLVYLPQFESLKRKLTNEVKGGDNNKYLSEILKQLEESFIMGKFCANSFRNKLQQPSKKTSPRNKPKENNKTKKSNSSYEKFRNFTYIKIADMVEVRVSFLENMLKSKVNSGKLEPNETISWENWKIISGFVTNKITGIKKKDYEPILKRSRTYGSPAPIKYIGGNFSKLILTGR